MDLFQCDSPTVLFFKFVTGEGRDNIFLDLLDPLLPHIICFIYLFFVSCDIIYMN